MLREDKLIELIEVNLRRRKRRQCYIYIYISRKK